MKTYNDRTKKITRIMIVMAAVMVASYLSVSAKVPDEDDVWVRSAKSEKSLHSFISDPAIRVIHLSPDAPAVDVWVNEASAVFTDIAFQESTAYGMVAAGTYDFQVVPTGGMPPMDTVLEINGLDLMADTFYTAVAYDTLDSLSALALVDDNSAVMGDNIRVRAIHTAAGVGEVDIWLIPEMGSPVPLWTDLGFAAAGDYLETAAAAFTIGFDVDNDTVPDLLFDIPALPTGTVANVFAVAATDDTVFLLAQLDNSTVARIDVREPARLRAIHLSPDAPAVDIWVDGITAAVTDLPFPESTDYLELDQGTYTFDIAPAGAGVGASVLTIADLALTAGMQYTAVAYDFLSDLSALALVDDPSEVPHGSIRVRAIHTASGVGEVDIWLLPDGGTPAPLWENLGYAEVGDYIETVAEAFTIGFDVDNDAVPDLVFDIPALLSGEVVNVFAVRDGDGNVFLIAQLKNGMTARIDSRPYYPDFGVYLSIPFNYVSPGDLFYVKADVYNPGSMQSNVPFFAVLDVGTGDYWFYPTWTMYPPNLDNDFIDLPTGVTTIDVIPELTWPNTGMDSFLNVHITAAILNSSFTEIVGDFDAVQFGYGPAM